MLFTKTWRVAAAVAVSLSVGVGAQAQTPAEDINLVVDGDGDVVVQNVGAAPLNLVGLTIGSVPGQLIPGNLTVLSGFEAPSSNSANNVGQFLSFGGIGTPFSLPVGNTALGSLIPGSGSAELIAIQTEVGFGNPAITGLSFEFGVQEDPFEPVVGDVILDGVQTNNLVLEVNTASGNISLVNDSSLDVQIAAIQITSPADALADANYTGFSAASRAVDGWDFNPGQNTSGNIVELLSPLDSPFDTIVAGESISLGNAYSQGADEDAGLTFTVNLVGGEGVLAEDIGQFSGAVAFVSDAGGNFNGDDVVNAADYAVLRDTSTDVVADHAVFTANFGTGAGATAASAFAVPEPSAVVIFSVLLSAAVAGTRSRVCG